MIQLIDIDPGNWRPELAVAEDQKRYVASPMAILARGYAYRHARSRAFIVASDDTPIGMGLYHDDPDFFQAYIFSELFIDARYQGKGYGRAATQLVLDAMRADGTYQKVVLCYIEGNEAAKKLYESFGFAEIDRDDDEIIMELPL